MVLGVKERQRTDDGASHFDRGNTSCGLCHSFQSDLVEIISSARGVLAIHKAETGKDQPKLYSVAAFSFR
jgi:hypothetical protein